MSNVNRVSAHDIHEGVVSGTTLLVCAYDDDSKFRNNNLEGAIPLSEFKTRVVDLERDTKIVFYCA
jgi:rhodanese-related sulfurtransferase